MTQSRVERPRGLAVLRWGLRKYGAVVIACALAPGVALPLLTATDSSYQAEALVVARQLEIDPSALPSYGQGIFTSGAMVQRVTADAASSGLAEEIVADRLDVVAAEDSIVLVVLARASQPLQAAQLADLAADAYVGELNKGGSGIGTFAVQSPAQIPSALTSDGSSSRLAAATGVIAGMLLSLGLIALIAAVRRPVLLAGDAAPIVGKPVIGVVVMPAAHAKYIPDPHEVPGLIFMARALLPLVDGSVVLASAQRTATVRQRLLVLLALTLSPYRNIFVSAAPSVQADVADKLGSAGRGAWGPTSGPGLELVDGVAPVDTLEVPEWPLPVILLIRYGEPAARVRRLVAQYVDDEMLGLVIVDERRGLLWKRASLNARRAAVVHSVPEAAPRTDDADADTTPLALRDEASPSR